MAGIAAPVEHFVKRHVVIRDFVLTAQGEFEAALPLALAVA